MHLNYMKHVGIFDILLFEAACMYNPKCTMLSNMILNIFSLTYSSSNYTFPAYIQLTKEAVLGAKIKGNQLIFFAV